VVSDLGEPGGAERPGRTAWEREHVDDHDDRAETYAELSSDAAHYYRLSEHALQSELVAAMWSIADSLGALLDRELRLPR